MRNAVRSKQRLWLLSPRADFWLVSAGASTGVLGAMLLLLWYGDREIDAVDFVLSEFHLGATYHAILQRRLWRRLPVAILLVPVAILSATYALSLSGHSILITSIALYAAVWHRGRQSWGIARFYQRAAGGPASRCHERLFRGAIYLPMLAAALAYTHLAPGQYEGGPYLALNAGAELTQAAGIAAVVCVAAYLFYAARRIGETAVDDNPADVHPAECWVVLAHAVAFGSSYALGAGNASFLFVLAVHHEVQYLYFTYAVSRRMAFSRGAESRRADGTEGRRSSYHGEHGIRSELTHAANFSLWPALGFAGAVAGGWLDLPLLAPLGVGGLFCHYWLDGRIWTKSAMAG